MMKFLNNLDPIWLLNMVLHCVTYSCFGDHILAVELKVGKLHMLSEAESMLFLVPFYTNGRNQN